jgi:hypothetical protein
MKVLFVVTCLALAPAPTRAQDEAGSAAPALPARDQLLEEIRSWRTTQLVHVTPPAPLTAEFEPPLDEIAARVKAAGSDADLEQPRKDFEAWQHAIVAKRYEVAKREGRAGGSLDGFSRAQRGLAGSFTQRNQAVAETKLGTFYDGGGAGTDGTSVAAGGRGGRAATQAEAQAQGLRTNAIPPPVTAKPLSLASLGDFIDRSGISDAVIKSVERIKNDVAGFGHMLSGFAGSCYYGAKWLLIKAHALPPEVAAPEEIEKIGIGSGSAYMMARALNGNPKLMAKLHMRRLDLTTIKKGQGWMIPERTVLVYNRGCAGFSEEHGHIEVSLEPEKIGDLPASAFYRVGRRGREYKPDVTSDDVLACSDGCAVRSTAFLRTYGRRCLSAFVPVVAAPERQTPAGLTSI